MQSAVIIYYYHNMENTQTSLDALISQLQRQLGAKVRVLREQERRRRCLIVNVYVALADILV